MVRLLILLSFSVSAFAHSNVISCEGALATTNTREQVIMFNFLAHLTQEIDHEYPADRFFRISAGRASGPLVASLLKQGVQANSLPLKMNFEADLIASSRAASRFNAVAKAFMPSAEQLNGKTIVLVAYEEDVAHMRSFVAMVDQFVAENKISPTSVQLHLLTRQDRARLMQETLNVLIGQDRVKVRGLAMANEVRHWLHDLSRGQIPAPTEYLMNDVFSDSDLNLKPEQTEAFKALKKRLKGL